MVSQVVKVSVTQGRKRHGGGACQLIAVVSFVLGRVCLTREAHFFDFLVLPVPLAAVERDVVERVPVLLVGVHMGRSSLTRCHSVHLPHNSR